MVALVLGLVILGGVIGIFLSNQRGFQTNEDLGRLQENARISFELMARELRQAGGNPCGASLTGNVLNDASTAWTSNWDSGVVQGFDGATAATGIIATGTAVTERVAGTDAIKVLSGGMFNGVTITNHDAANSRITLNVSNHGFGVGDVAMICDGESAAIARLTAVTTGTPGTVDHAAGLGATDNCRIGLGFPVVCAQTTAGIRNFTPGGFVTRMTATTWYIGNNPRGGRSLYRVTRAAPEEIAEGATDMQIDYLVRNSAGNLGTDWVAADTITDWSPLNTSQVMAARVQLQLQSTNRVGTDQAGLRRQMIHVVDFRNRAQ